MCQMQLWDCLFLPKLLGPAPFSDRGPTECLSVGPVISTHAHIAWPIHAAIAAVD